MSLSLSAAGYGAGYALPLLLASAFGHTAAAKRAFPVLDELHTAQRELVAPLVAGAGLRGTEQQKLHHWWQACCVAGALWREGTAAPAATGPHPRQRPFAAPPRRAGMSPMQLSVLLSFVVLPSLMVLLPGAKVRLPINGSLVV
jgi:hypothetical protein